MSCSRIFAIMILSLGCISGLLFAEPPFDPDALLKKESRMPKGQRYEAMVPDTLDLAEQAKLSINVLTGNVEPKQFYGVYQGYQFNINPPKPLALTWNITPKNARTLPTLRVMTGSDLRLDVDDALLRAMLQQIRKDGQMYYPFDGEGPPKGTSYPQTNASMVFAMLNRYEIDGNPAWLEAADLLCKGLRKVAVQVGDRAYYPLQCGITPDGTWHSHFRKGEKLPIDYSPTKEPELDQQGMEGAAKSDQVRCLSVLAKHYERTGDKESLEMARKLARFCLKPGMWEDTIAEGYPAHEHGIFGGHFHNNICCFMAFLDLALVDGDQRLKQIVREGYDHARQSGVLQLGWFPSWTLPEKYNRPAILHEITEPCALADMVTLAVKMSDAGLGDYWDDVDSILRNHLIAQQLTNLDHMRRISGGGSANDELHKRFIGGFAQGNPTAVEHGFCTIPGCCTVNGARSYYYAWHGITRFADGIASVNLFLNRASPWLDVDSYLPYEGKVVVRNKKAHTIQMRIPAWLDPAKVSGFVNDQPVKPTLVGRSLTFQNLKPGDVIRLAFAVPERTDKHTIHGKEYLISFRGSTVIDIKPQKVGPKDYPLYERDALKKDTAPIRKVNRFVADKIIPLGPY